MRSDTVNKGFERAANRSLFRANGLHPIEAVSRRVRATVFGLRGHAKPEPDHTAA